MGNRDLRVVQMSAAYIGAQKQIEDAIYSELLSQNVESKVLYWVGDASNSDYIKCESSIENAYRRFCYKYINKSYRFSKIQTKRAILFLERFHPSIVHLHSIHHGYIDYPLLFDYLREREIRIVYTVHDMWPFTGGCYYYTSLNCTGFLDGCRHCPNNPNQHDCDLKKTAEVLHRKKQCYEKQNITFVAVSNWVQTELEKSFLKDYPHCVIHNCINYESESESTDISLDDETLKALREKKTLVFVAASWDERKGYNFICDLAALLGNEYKLILVGNINDELRKKAKQNMIFTGYLNNRKDLLYLYKNCTLHASASKEETFGMTFVEAALEGTRSIGFDSTAVRETISGVHGICVSGGTVNQFYKKIVEHINDPKLNQEEIDRIRFLYSKETMAHSYLALYREIERV